MLQWANVPAKMHQPRMQVELRGRLCLIYVNVVTECPPPATTNHIFGRAVSLDCVLRSSTEVVISVVDGGRTKA